MLSALWPQIQSPYYPLALFIIMYSRSQPRQSLEKRQVSQLIYKRVQDEITISFVLYIPRHGLIIHLDFLLASAKHKNCVMRPYGISTMIRILLRSLILNKNTKYKRGIEKWASWLNSTEQSAENAPAGTMDAHLILFVWQTTPSAFGRIHYFQEGTVERSVSERASAFAS